MKFNFKLGKISCNDAERKFAMDESSISLEMDPSELIELYKLEKELNKPTPTKAQDINKPTPTKAQDINDIDELKQDLKNLFKEEIKNEDEDEDEYNIYLH